MENEECFEDPVTGVSKCACPKCDDVEKEEVCGSDGITYYSQCHLRQAACIQRSDIGVNHYGPCGKSDQE